MIAKAKSSYVATYYSIAHQENNILGIWAQDLELVYIFMIWPNNKWIW